MGWETRGRADENGTVTTFGTVKFLKYLTRKLVAPKIKNVESLRTRIQVVVLPCETVDDKAKARADHFQLSWMRTRRRRLYTPFNAQLRRTVIINKPTRSLGLATPTHTHSRKTPHPHPDFDRCLALTLEQSLTESRPRFRARRGYSAAQQAAIKTKPTAKPGRRRASPRFDTYSLVIPASCPDTVRSQTGMTSRLRPHARRRPLQQRNGR